MEVEGKKRFPLREAYVFAAENELADQASEIQEMEIEWDRGYTSSVRRGRLIRLFQARELMPQFIARYWPFGSSPSGEAELRHCRRIGDDYEGFLSGRLPDAGSENNMSESASLEFALEAHLRDFLVKNLGHIEPGMRLYQVDGKSGVEFAIDGGRIDILAVDASGRYVVIELKLSHGRNKALGQLLYYMGWVDTNLGNGPCRGIIIASEIAEELTIAVSRVSGVTLHQYKMNFAIERAGASSA